jgi:hypothetical protein
VEFFNHFAENEEGKAKGVWVKYLDSELLIAHQSGLAYGRAIQELYEKNSEILDIDNPTLEQLQAQEKINIEATIDTYAEFILLDFKNVTYQGKKLKYSKEAAKQLLEHSKFRQWVSVQSSDSTNYEAEKFEEKLGNSETP